MKFNVNHFEETINEILPGLTVYVRDVNLPKELEEKYIPDTIILEPGFTDASARVMGMKTTHRFAILSNHMKDFSQFEHDTNWGLFVANCNSHFLILDKYEYHGKTQIMLLHLPNDKRWKLFENVKINVLDNVIRETRQRFENKCEQEVIPELATDEWLDRCSAPLGMNDNGDLFDLNINLERCFRKIGETNFRNLYHQIIYIRPTEELRASLSKHFDVISEDDGVLAYGYIDDQAGFSFRILCSANIKSNKLSRGKFVSDVYIIIRRGQLNPCEYIDMDYCDLDTADFDKEIKGINDICTCESEQTETMRRFAFLDEVRSIDYPDDIQVILVKEGLNPEQVWAKCWAFTEKELFAKMLNEPNQDFGVHIGSVIGFSPMEHEGNTLCVYTGRWLEEQE